MSQTVGKCSAICRSREYVVVRRNEKIAVGSGAYLSLVLGKHGVARNPMIMGKSLMD